MTQIRYVSQQEAIESFITEAYVAGQKESNGILHAIEKSSMDMARTQGFAAAIGKVKEMVPELKSVDTTERPDNFRNLGFNSCRAKILQSLTLIEESTV